MRNPNYDFSWAQSWQTVKQYTSTTTCEFEGGESGKPALTRDRVKKVLFPSWNLTSKRLWMHRHWSMQSVRLKLEIWHSSDWLKSLRIQRVWHILLRHSPQVEDDENLSPFIVAGLFRLLFEIIRPAHRTRLTRNALFIIANLCVGEKNSAHFLQEGGLEQVLPFAIVKDESGLTLINDSQEAALLTLCNCTANSVAIITKLVTELDAVAPLTALIIDAYPTETRRLAVRCLSYLSEHGMRYVEHIH